MYYKEELRATAPNDVPLPKYPTSKGKEPAKREEKLKQMALFTRECVGPEMSSGDAAGQAAPFPTSDIQPEHCPTKDDMLPASEFEEGDE